MPPPAKVRGLNLRIDMAKVEEALATQPRLVVSSISKEGKDVTLLEISRQVGDVMLDDNQVNVLC